MRADSRFSGLWAYVSINHNKIPLFYKVYIYGPSWWYKLSFFYFRRTPRMREHAAEPRVELQRPPGLPIRPSFRYRVLLMPAAALVTAALAACYYAPIPRQATSYLAIGIVLTVMLAAIARNHIRRHRIHLQAYERAVLLCERELAAYWTSVRERTERMRVDEREALEETHPEPGLCAERAALRVSSVWEREAGDPDFLHLRIGTGAAPSRAKLILPKQEGRVKDAFYRSAERLASEGRDLTDAPVWVDVKKFGTIGIIGQEQAAESLLRALIIQLAAHHAPNEAKVAALFDERRSGSWSWLRWLPHSWDDEREYRYLFQAQRYRRETMERFLAELRHRKRRADGGDERSGGQLPTFICLIPNASALDAHPDVRKLLLAESQTERICTIMMAPSRDRLPAPCSLVIELWPDRGAIARRTSNGTSSGRSAAESETEAIAPKGRFMPDQVTLVEAERFARTLAPYRLMRDIAGSKETERADNWAEGQSEDVQIGQLGLDGEKKPLTELINRRIDAALERSDAGPESAH